MTAINIVRMAAELHIYTDGALCETDGRIVHIAPKAWPLVHLLGVVTARGAGGLAVALASELSKAATFDAAAAALPTVVRQLQGLVRTYAGRDPTLGDGEIIFCGWSPAKAQFEHWMVPTDDRYGDEHPAFTAKLQHDPLVAMPFTAELAREFVCPAAEAFDPIRDGVPLMELQRRLGWIGAFIQHTVVTPTQIRSSIIHRWPDSVGQLLAASN